MKNIILSECELPLEIKKGKLFHVKYSERSIDIKSLFSNTKLFFQDPIDGLAHLLQAGYQSSEALTIINDVIVNFLNSKSANGMYRLEIHLLISTQPNLGLVDLELFNPREIVELRKCFNNEKVSDYLPIAKLMINASQDIYSNLRDFYSYFGLEGRLSSCCYTNIDMVSSALKEKQTYESKLDVLLEENSTLLNELHLAELAVQKTNLAARKSKQEHRKKLSALNDVKSQKRKLTQDNNHLKSRVRLLRIFATAANNKLYKQDRSYRKKIHKAIEEIRAKGIFDDNKYQELYTDVAEARIDPLLHYVIFGWIEGRSTNLNYDLLEILEDSSDEFETLNLPFIPFPLSEC